MFGEITARCRCQTLYADPKWTCKIEEEGGGQAPLPHSWWRHCSEVVIASHTKEQSQLDGDGVAAKQLLSEAEWDDDDDDDDCQSFASSIAFASSISLGL